MHETTTTVIGLVLGIRLLVYVGIFKDVSVYFLVIQFAVIVTSEDVIIIDCFVTTMFQSDWLMSFFVYLMCLSVE